MPRERSSLPSRERQSTAEASLRVEVPLPSLPKGGGALRSIDEKFRANSVTGSGSLSIPLPASPGRSGFGPQLALTYDSGAGNGAFGLGWRADAPAITRKTAKQIPLFNDEEESDVFLLSGAEDLVPVVEAASGLRYERLLTVREEVDLVEVRYTIHRYRPRTEGLFARIERWTNRDSGETHWRATTRDNVTSLYGRSPRARIADPRKPARVLSWLIEETRDDRGNAIRYEYKEEDLEGVNPAAVHERNRLSQNGMPPLAPVTNRYLERIRYGNRTMVQPLTLPLTEPLTDHEAARLFPSDWCFELIFDFGEHGVQHAQHSQGGELTVLYEGAAAWPVRGDPFSEYRGGFEVRTWRLCHRILMFHRFSSLGEHPCLVRSLDLAYEDGPVLTYLRAITQRGYERITGDTYRYKSFPPVELDYTRREVNQQLQFVDRESLENLPYGLEGGPYRWVDLDGEGISGILAEHEGTWLYKRNLGGQRYQAGTRLDVDFGPVETVATRPASTAAKPGHQLLDLEGDGRLDLVQLERPHAGYQARTAEGRWEKLTLFQAPPNLDWDDPNLRLVDLDGDGHADILVTREDLFVWYRSRAREGFEGPRFVRKLADEEAGPTLVFDDPSESVFLADMSGDGSADLVRIRNGEVCYWPNIGYGRFSAKVTMSGSPWFDSPDQFDPRRIRLADIDGTGPTDIVYLHRDGVDLYFNHAGNGWSGAERLSGVPLSGLHTSVQVADLLGNGTACLVWSSPLPGDAQHPVVFVDLMRKGKPHLLSEVRNNLGATTRIAYASSTRFYLEDRRAGRPWATRLPFPVHVVERVETWDAVSRTRLVATYRYRHGFYDGHEREFHGFGYVEQRDAEAISAYAGMGGHTETPPANEAEEFLLPPVLAKTWNHTGAWVDRERISRQFVKEYHGAPSSPTFDLADTVLPEDLPPEEGREACRALKGRVLRQEIYAEDGSELSGRPYRVTESNYTLRLLQARGANRHAVFLVHPRETVDVHSERNPEDPRVQHALTLDVDSWGNVTLAAVVGYPRRQPVIEEQAWLAVTATESRFFNSPDELPEDTRWHRIGVPTETRAWEVVPAESRDADNRFAVEELKQLVEEAQARPYEEVPAAGDKRLLDHTRVIYADDQQAGPLPLGAARSKALPWQTYQLAFTPGLLDSVFGDRVTEAMLSGEGRYARENESRGEPSSPPQDSTWWVPSGRQVFDVGRFSLPVQVIDPWEAKYEIEYDSPHDLLITRVRDPFGNETVAEIDYRVRAPYRIVGPNGNHSGVRFDELRMVVATWVAGREGEGDTPEDPTTELGYDLFRWMEGGAPVRVYSRARERHGPENPRWQESYAYSDGLGREIMRKVQAEPGDAPVWDPVMRRVVRDHAGEPNWEHTDDRWVGTGRTVFNNKGSPVKQYEPYFSSTSDYEDESDVIEQGVTPILRYDPLGRLIRTDLPNGTFSKVGFDPWQQLNWDENDTVLESRWYADRGAPDPAGSEPGDAETRAAWLAARHAGTPVLVRFDTLGRVVRSIQHNGPDGQYETRFVLDIEGNQREVIDARGNTALGQDFDIAGRLLHTVSTDAGERWALPDVAGKPIRSWDGRGHGLRRKYDPLQRPTHLFVQLADGEILAERSIYGESLPIEQARAGYLLGQLYRQLDGAGLVTQERYDFKGNLARTSRRLAVEYRSRPDWSPLDGLEADSAAFAAAAAPLLEEETWVTENEVDALNRPVRQTTPDGSVTLSEFNEANLLERLSVRLRGGEPVTAFVTDIDYNARGQRVLVVHGNGVRTEYQYDSATFRLQERLTERGESERLQHYRYTYDPVGNITGIVDQAADTIFFNNTVVDAHARYEYDALYRLRKATGREHAGQGTDSAANRPELKPEYDFNDSTRTGKAHPHDGGAMRRYLEEYLYDEVGNILELGHWPQVEGATPWTRRYQYAATSNRLTSTSLPGDHPNPQSNSGGTYGARYEHDEHGNMTRMPHLPLMRWDFANQLEATAGQVREDGGTPETTYYAYDVAGQRARKVTESGAPPDIAPQRIKERIYLAGVEVFREFAGGGGSIVLERETLHIVDATQRVALVDTKIVDAQSAITGPQPLARYHYGNHLGSTSLELDEEGQIISHEEYYPYGSTSSETVRGNIEGNRKRYRYAGKERDEETNLCYHGARYYAPWLGRWTSADPRGILDGTNLYTYVTNRPTVLTDPYGQYGVEELSQDVQRVTRLVTSLNPSSLLAYETGDFIGGLVTGKTEVSTDYLVPVQGSLLTALARTQEAADKLAEAEWAPSTSDKIRAIVDAGAASLSAVTHVATALLPGLKRAGPPPTSRAPVSEGANPTATTRSAPPSSSTPRSNPAANTPSAKPPKPPQGPARPELGTYEHRQMIAQAHAVMPDPALLGTPRPPLLSMVEVKPVGWSVKGAIGQMGKYMYQARYFGSGKLHEATQIAIAFYDRQGNVYLRTYEAGGHQRPLWKGYGRVPAKDLPTTKNWEQFGREIEPHVNRVIEKLTGQKTFNPEKPGSAGGPDWRPVQPPLPHVQ